MLVLCLFVAMLPAVTVPSQALTVGYTVSSSYASSSYYSALCSVTLTGNQREDIINVALSQVGYREGSYSGDYSGAYDASYNNYTEYNYWYNNYVNSGMPVGGSYAPWCATFVSWCARRAEIPTSVIQNSTIAGRRSNGFNVVFYSGSSTLASDSDNDSYFMGYNYTPQKGDLFFTRSWSHVGLVVSCDGTYVTTVEGNTNNDGSADGFGVFVRTRYVGDLYFGVPTYEEGYIDSECTYYPAHCQITIDSETPINTQPCSVSTTYDSENIGTATVGQTYTATALYCNSYGNYWYRIQTDDGEAAYLYAGDTTFVKEITSDITIKDAEAPDAHVQGSSFTVCGTISSEYNKLVTAACNVYTGFNQGGSAVTGYSDSVNGTQYTLNNSNIDYNVLFGTLENGNHTYEITVSYINYYATSNTTTASNTGTVTLMQEFFVVIPSAVDQSGCSHSFVMTDITPGSCTQSGYAIKACSTCGYITEGATGNTGHSFGSWTTISGTCTTPGSKSRSCTACGYTETESIANSGHSYTSSYTAPTCTTGGGTTYTCIYCGDSYSETTEPAGHSYDNGVIITPAGCNSTGVRKYTCTVCGHSYQKSIYATGHTYDAGVVTQPTCTTAGYTTYTCTGCGSTYESDSVPATGHTYGALVTAPTCTTTGYTTYTCMDCGSTYRGNFVPATGHTYGGGTVTAPTCTSSGYTTYACMDCGYSYKDNIVSAVGHKYQSQVTEPTCTTAGYTTYTCTACGDSYKSNAVSATGHTYSSGYCMTCGTKDPSYVAAPTVTLKNPTLAFEDEILYNVYFNVDNMSAVTEMGLLTFATRDTEGTAASALEIIPGYVANADGTYTVHSNGIAPKNLGDALYFKVYAMTSDGRYAYSDIAGYNAVAYAKTVLGGSTTLAAKQLMIAMLNYGAAAQVNFGYNTDNLMNAFLPEAAQNQISAYDESMVDDVVAASSDKAGHFVMNTTAFTKVYPSVSFEGSFAINYYLETGLTPDSGVTFLYWNAEAYESATKLTSANATGMMPMTNDGTRYHAQVGGIAAKDMDQTIYVAAIYKNNGTSYTTSVIAYSLGRYCETIAANGNAFGAATAVYGYYAKAYFAN